MPSPDTCTTGSLDKAVRLLAGVVITTSVILGLVFDQRWFYLTLFAGLNLLQSGFTNWCPAIAVFRRLGLR